MAGRAVQAVAKPKHREPVEAPPPAKPPEMVESTGSPSLRPTAAEARREAGRPSQEPDADHRRRDQDRRRRGSTPAARRFRSAGWRPGGGGTGGVQLDVNDFCCPEYIAPMDQRIRQNWNPQPGRRRPAVDEVHDSARRHADQRRGRRTSGQDLLDLEARRAVLKTSSCRRCRASSPSSTLTVYLTFESKR